MSKDKYLLFLTGKTEPDVLLECIQMEHGEPRPPTQCYLCKRQEGKQSVGIKVEPGSVEPSATSLELKVKYVRASSTPDADVFFPLCRDCCILLDLWPSEKF